jgi:hypothetical protein
MKKPPLVSVNSVEELKKILFLQGTITRAVKTEVLAVAIDTQNPEKFIPAAKALLAKYAKHPTLTEFSKNPKLTTLYKWGATFGVTALIGILIFEGSKVLQISASEEVRRIFLLLLKNLDRAGEEISADVNAMNALESLIALSMAYGIMIRKKEKLTLTSVGHRVLRHLTDAARFIEEMGQVHTKFQAEKAKADGR